MIDLIYDVGLENDCFFWSDSDEWMLKFRELDGKLQLKVNVKSVADVIKAAKRYRANIVEVGLDNMSRELVAACRDLGLKVMVYHQEKDPEAFREVIRWGVDMINLNHGDVFAQVAREFRK